MIYAKTSKGFRSGGQQLRATSATTAIPFQPEVIFAHEARLKGEFLDHRLRVNLAGYYTITKDIQRSLTVGFPNGLTSTLLNNAGKYRVFGLEGEVTAQVADDLQLGFNGAIAKPKYLRYDEVANRTNLSGDRRVERVQEVPEYQFATWAEYQHEFVFGAFKIRGDYSWTSAYALQSDYASLGNPLSVTIDPSNGRTVIDNIIAASTSPKQGGLGARTSISILDNRLELAIFGRNLTDNRKPVGAVSVPGIGFVSLQLREPRTFGGSATYRF
ncbi:MAG: TonB-dependent receptor [Sphingobium sp.]